MDAINSYTQWSGKMLTYGSLASCFSKNTKPSNIANLCNCIGIQKQKIGGKYLGLPKRKMAFQEIKDKILSKITAWKAKCLSQASRCMLIRVVASSLPIYCLSTFLLPTSWSQKLMVKFEKKKKNWGFENSNNRHFTSIAWEHYVDLKMIEN